ncbi:MAG: S8 family serine peptidase [Saprospirales bacterium]|nr:S8 family serine peptidase [Saprospirales bacterium]
MKLACVVLVLLISLFFQPAAIAQRNAHVPGQLLVSLPPGQEPAFLLARLPGTPSGASLRVKQRVADLLNVWLLETDANDAAERQMLEWLRLQPGVAMAQFNHLLEQRARPPALLPNDPLFDQQWQHINTGATGGTPNADFDSELAWEISTGGLTAQGDTIVVAVVDNGIQFQHEDLIANMWRNSLEIPGDGLDNDANGYVDDFRGWNVYAGNDDVSGQSVTHGTPVSAIIGASGNNGIGVTGISWNVKILFVAGSDQESNILAAYDYILKARKRYNATNGQQGAFVVAANSSFGVTYGQPSSSPLWCAAFDTLGAAGILSVAATANTPLDVDLEGDLPTACPSDYLIGVTSLNKWDNKADNAAWGAKSVDLGAYGKDVFSAGANNSYGAFSGTSFAAPQVSGAIGLLYAAPCDNLIAVAKADPAAAALWVKEQILTTAAPNAALANITVSGGRLHLLDLLESYEDQCVQCLAPVAVAPASIADNQIILRWSAVSAVQSVNVRWRKRGDLFWTLAPSASNPFLLSNLSACTEYEFTLRGSCSSTSLSTWTTPIIVRTLGCCSAPLSIQASTVGPTQATLTWSGPPTATGYRVRVRPAGGDWAEYQPDSSLLQLSDLLSCTVYDVELQSLCDPDSLSAPTLAGFKTLGCGACTDLFYCASKASSAKDEWIAGVQLGSWSNVSAGGAGYQDFSDLPGPPRKYCPAPVWRSRCGPAFPGSPTKSISGYISITMRTAFLTTPASWPSTPAMPVIWKCPVPSCLQPLWRLG